MSQKIEIATIRIKIGQTELNLTPTEVRDLKSAIDDLYRQNVKEYVPLPYPYPQPMWIPTPAPAFKVTWGNVSLSAESPAASGFMSNLLTN